MHRTAEAVRPGHTATIVATEVGFKSGDTSDRYLSARFAIQGERTMKKRFVFAVCVLALFGLVPSGSSQYNRSNVEAAAARTIVFDVSVDARTQRFDAGLAG